MPIDYKIIEEKQLVLAKGIGLVTGNDVLRHLDELAADDKYLAPMKKLVDYRLIDSISISPEEAKEISLKKQALSDKFRGETCAFVSPKDLAYGTTRVHQAYFDSEGIYTKVFRKIEEALDWLEIRLDMDV